MTKAYRNIESLNHFSFAIFKDIAFKAGFFDVRFLTHWKEIVGEEVSSKCSPAKLIYDQFTKSATLFLHSEDFAFKSMFTHYKAFILEKVKLYFGVPFIVDVKIIKKI